MSDRTEYKCEHCKKVYAFDANSKNIDMLEKSIILNNINNIETFCCAIVDDEQKFFKTSTSIFN